MNKAVLIVFDGFGIAPPGPGNAIALAKPENYERYIQSYPSTTLKASGEAVGLPAGEVGNTEVGHINLGAGKIIYQDLPRINMSIADGTFYENETLRSAIAHIQKSGGKFHIIGLIGEGSVHSDINHLYALLYFAREQKLNEVYIHAITDGRDSPPKSAGELMKQIQEKITPDGIAHFASVMGRYYAMDRDHRWERTQRAYTALTTGSPSQSATLDAAIERAYTAGKTDEFIEPTNIVGVNGKPVLIQEGDAVIFFNFRIDRPRQLTKAFVLEHFETEANITKGKDPYSMAHQKQQEQTSGTLSLPFTRGPRIENLYFATMTEYEKDLPAPIVFPPVKVHFPLGKVLADNAVSQLRMSESEKERFVTFYFNGQREAPYELEDRIIIPSPKVATYDMQPEMSSVELSNTLIAQMKEQKYPFILVNFPNADMVGHTGNIEATIQAIQALDTALKKIVDTALISGYTLFITADHGNAEQKINPHTGQISTEHTDNPVPFLVIGKEFEGKYVHLQPGILSDVAPTILAYMGIPKPAGMSGRNLLEDIR